ncbi:hypothetical protein KY321_04965 [Candidatus Woesearchaeota archaeon]|nr:hypothetical protein [Candidatus Woesearchaeota archaeon]
MYQIRLEKMLEVLLQNSNCASHFMIKEANKRLQKIDCLVWYNRNDYIFCSEANSDLELQPMDSGNYVLVNPHHAMKFTYPGYFDDLSNAKGKKIIERFDRIDFSDIKHEPEIKVKMNDYLTDNGKMSECSKKQLSTLYKKVSSLPRNLEVGGVPNFEYCAALKYFMGGK